MAGLEVDLLWREQRVIAEVDGGEFHATPQAFTPSGHRRARPPARHAAADGRYRVARFTWRQVGGEPETVAACLSALLAAASAAPSWGRR